MSEAIRQHLVALYGADIGTDAAAQLVTLLDTFRKKGLAQRTEAQQRLTQADALLITYGDQMREANRLPLATLADFVKEQLTGVVSGVHILPFYPWSSDDGFSVKDFFAVDPALGGWPEVERIGKDFDLMFDAVFNHMSAQGEWFKKFQQDDPAFRDFFVTVEGNPDLSQVVRPRALPLLTEFHTAAGPKKVWTTFSADQVDLNFKNPRVLLATMEALLFYVAKGARFIRLDAIAFLWKEIGTRCQHLPQTHRVIQLMRTVLDETAPHVQLITETNVPHTENLSYFGDGTHEAQLVYNFALPPLVLHTLATGNAEKLTGWAQSLRLPSDRTTFFNFLASHDGIGLNPARGILTAEEIDALVARTLAHGGFVSYKHNPDGTKSPYEMNINYLDALSAPGAGETDERAAGKFLIAQAIMLSLQGVPGIYFHSLFGSRGDRAGAVASEIPRRINREKLDRALLESQLAEPGSLRARVFSGLRDLLSLRRAHPAFAPSSPQRILNLGARAFGVLRESADGRDRVLCLHNVSDQPVSVSLEETGLGSRLLAPLELKWLPLPAR